MKTFIKHILAVLALLVGSYSAQAQVKIGNNPTSINGGSLLELESTNKGLLMPRISLTNTSTWGLSGTAVAGMHVYNTNASITSTTATCPTLADKVGEYYWNGSCWVAYGQTGQGSVLIYSGFRATNVNIAASTGVQPQPSTPMYDPYNGYSGNSYTIPYDGWYVISHLWKVLYNGSSSVTGYFSGFIGIRPNATGAINYRAQTQFSGFGSLNYPFNNTITMYLTKGEQVVFTVQPCQGCSGMPYVMSDVFQTITGFK